MAWLIANERVRDYGCDSLRAAAEYFGKSCAPGAQSAAFQDRYSENYWEYSHLCDLCHGTAGSYCRRNHMEDYYGHTGAFRYSVRLLRFYGRYVLLFKLHFRRLKVSFPWEFEEFWKKYEFHFSSKF